MTTSNPVFDPFPAGFFGDRPRAQAGERCSYEVNVIASRVVDVVSSAGGWLFDLQMAGWQVNVLVADRSDERALRILGARILDRHGESASGTGDPHRASTLVVAAELVSTDERVRKQVLRAVRRGTTEVALWGDTCPWQLGPGIGPAQHRLSGAARAFKAHALAATGMPSETVGMTETLFRCTATTGLPLHFNLAPLS